MSVRLRLFKSKLHRATVTHADLDYEGSVTIDANLLDAAGIRDHEEVHVWNLSNGERLTTCVVPVDEPNTMRLNGSAAHKARAGDKAIIAGYRWVDENSLGAYRAPVLVLGDENQVTQRMLYDVNMDAGTFDIVDVDAPAGSED